MSMPPRDPSFPAVAAGTTGTPRPPLRHPRLTFALGFILFPIAMKTGAQYGPLSLWTGIGMNLSILLTCLTILLAIPG